MCARFSEQRFDLGKIAEDRFAFLVVLSEVVGRSRGDPAQQHIGRRAEQDNGIELRVEATLVRHGAGDVDGMSVLACQKLADPILAPDVAAVVLGPFTPATDVGLDHVEALSRELYESRGLASA